MLQAYPLSLHCIAFWTCIHSTVKCLFATVSGNQCISNPHTWVVQVEVVQKADGAIQQISIQWI